jgi:hypothetical protein
VCATTSLHCIDIAYGLPPASALLLGNEYIARGRIHIASFAAFKCSTYWGLMWDAGLRMECFACPDHAPDSLTHATLPTPQSWKKEHWEAIIRQQAADDESNRMRWVCRLEGMFKRRFSYKYN